MKKLIFILIGFLFFSGCKKEPLTEEFQPLEGEWKWIGVVSGNSFQGGFGSKKSHTLVFYSDGTYKVINKQDGGRDEKGRIIKVKFGGTKTLSYGYPPGSTETKYSITLKKQLFGKNAYLNGDYEVALTFLNQYSRLYLDGYLGFATNANYAVYDKK